MVASEPAFPSPSLLHHPCSASQASQNRPLLPCPLDKGPGLCLVLPESSSTSSPLILCSRHQSWLPYSWSFSVICVTFAGRRDPTTREPEGRKLGGGRSGPRLASSGPRTHVQPIKHPLSLSERGCDREVLLCFPCLVTVGSLCPFPSLATSPLPVLRAPFPTASHTFLSKVARIGNSCLLPRSLTCPLTIKVTQIGASQNQAFTAATFHCSGPSPWSPQ